MMTDCVHDLLMSCPCGQGEYDRCLHCPYPWCSRHGSRQLASPGARTEIISVRVSPELLHAVSGYAQQDVITVSGWVRRLIEDAVAGRDRRRKEMT
jgi:hypothetical protein